MGSGSDGFYFPSSCRHSVLKQAKPVYFLTGSLHMVQVFVWVAGCALGILLHIKTKTLSDYQLGCSQNGFKWFGQSHSLDLFSTEMQQYVYIFITKAVIGHR